MVFLQWDDFPAVAVTHKCLENCWRFELAVNVSSSFRRLTFLYPIPEECEIYILLDGLPCHFTRTDSASRAYVAPIWKGRQINPLLMAVFNRKSSVAPASNGDSGTTASTTLGGGSSPRALRCGILALPLALISKSQYSQAVKSPEMVSVSWYRTSMKIFHFFPVQDQA